MVPKWARKRFVLPALAVVFLIGVGAGASGSDGEPNARKSASRPTATETRTVTETARETATATPKAARPEPAATVTVRATKTVRSTVTVRPPGDGGADEPGGSGSGGSGSGGSGSGGSGGSVFYENCAAARAAGAAPVHRGEPGYGRHLDRDGDGVGFDS
ncbi:excalibur calcium-binding domain-containing protein [Streptomyces silvensis]|uniref:Excalibur calcium-binding domain-containing protein n=1 Tax=Streptomyces silvensis TaxID=1765722 RepID=A0A0W7WU83_9ACTN|nr:excalibur calcium-binding domain-containing protein [Streptomyces silvensis]KUF14145.1 hypothetical protein AT728_02680 [Streptomyces silvensis]